MVSDSELVALWETGQREHPLIRALHVLALSEGASEQEAWASKDEPIQLLDLDLAERNRRLMAFFVESFGSSLEFESSCPKCEEGVEVDVDLGSIRAQDHAEDRVFQASAEGVEMQFRLPSTRDLLALARCDEPRAARRLLFARCIVECTQDGESVPTSELSPAHLERMADEMSRSDPHAEILLRLSCPECEASWRVVLDLAEHVWARIERRSRAAVEAVHRLARAYGWSEPEILSLSAARRALYLSMVEA